MNLRYYQNDGTAACRALWKQGWRNTIIVLPTGCGKTMTALSEVAKAAEAGKRALWLAHRKELVNQPARAFRGVWKRYAELTGIVKGAQDDPHKLIVFASVDTLKNPARLARYLETGPPDLVIVDEAHHYPEGNGYGRFLAELDRIGVEIAGKVPIKIGLTATPDRADRKRLAPYWRSAYFYSITKAFRDGFLVQPTFKQELLPKLDEELAGADINDDEQVGRAMLKAEAVPHTVKVLNEVGRGRRVMVFTANVGQAQETAEALTADGWNARWVSGTTADKERDRLLAAFTDGTIDVLCNCGVLTEGTDLPPTDCIVVARPLRSRSLYMQIIGRGLRLFPGKEDCLVIDLVGSSSEHKLIVAPVLLAEEEAKQDKRDELVDGAKVVHLQHPEWGVGVIVRVDVGDVYVVAWPMSPSHPEGERTKAGIDDLEIAPSQGSGKPGKPREEKTTWEFKKPPRAAWVRVRDVAPPTWAVDCGQDHGFVAVIDRGDDGWDSLLVPKRGPEVRLADGPVDFELARGLGEDVARQAAQLTHGKAKWRNGPATEKQLEMLRKFRVDIDALEAACDDKGLTCGVASDAVTEQFVKRALNNKKLVTRTDKSL